MAYPQGIFETLDWLTKKVKRLYAIVNSNTQTIQSIEARFNNPCFLEIIYKDGLRNGLDRNALLFSALPAGYTEMLLDSDTTAEYYSVQKFYGGGGIYNVLDLVDNGGVFSINDGCGAITEIGGGNGIFANQPIQYANLPNITNIPTEAFRETDLRSAFFPRVATVESGAFHSCPLLYNVDLPIATSIGDNAFYNCSTLSLGNILNINLPALQTLGTDVFLDTTGRTITLTIPAALELDPNIQYLISNNAVNLNLV
jgi:hypothetical protein